MPPQNQPPAPSLTPQFCLTPTSLASFLNRSRALSDDTISQNLSALSNPSANPFRVSPNARLPSTSRLPNSSCGAFIAGSLLPAWSDRDAVLMYCDAVAQGKDLVSGDEGNAGEGEASEAEAWARVERMRERGAEQYSRSGWGRRVTVAEDGKDEQPDERLDPYSARVEKPESRVELLQRVLRSEREVEDIVRRRSWGVVRDRCTGVDGSWQEVMKSWESKRDVRSES